MTGLDAFYTQKQAAAALGIHTRVLKRLVAAGAIKPATTVGRSYLYSREDIDKAKAEQYPEGLACTDIARLYTKAPNTVMTNFQRLEVQPVGWNRRRQAYVYDLDTVRRTALSLGWLENPKDGSSDPAYADSAT